MNDSNLNALRQQWLDQQALHERGALDAAAYAAAREALEARIVAAVVAAEPSPAAPAAALVAEGGPPASAQSLGQSPANSPAVGAAAPARVPGRLWGAAAAFALVLAVLGYGWKGTPRAVGTPPPGFETQAGGTAGAAAAPLGAPQRSGSEELQTLVLRLSERLKDKPDDTEGWALLARSQMTLGRFAEASAAYEKLRALKPDDPSVLTDHADALGVLNGRTLEGEPTRLLERALKLDPKHIKALVLVGTMEFQRGNYAAAQARWEEAVRVGPAGDGLVELAREGVAQAQARQRSAAAGAGGAGAGVAAGAAAATRPQAMPASAAGTSRAAAGPAASPSDTPPAAGGNAAIRGTVRLTDAMKSQAAPGDTVFIFARAANPGGGSGGMPLAIVQKRVSELPATFTLDDSQAMSPAARLSSAQQVVITARVSKSGQATPQPGDLEGVSAPVAPGARDLVVEIANVRR